MRILWLGLVASALLAGCSKETGNSESANTKAEAKADQNPKRKLILTAEWKGVLSGYRSTVTYYDNGECEYEN